jgi:hypothetical protein
MRPWVDGSGAQAPAPAPSSTPTTSERLRAASTSLRPQASTRVTVAGGEALRTSQTIPSEVEISPTNAASAPTSMVAQIDAILQRQLASTPLAALGIRLVESLNGGVTVMVGKERFSGVGEVPDPKVQAVIRAAIAEWEAKYTPG